MTERYPLTYRFIWITALTMVALGMFFPVWTTDVQLVPALTLVVLGGIPHGATDYLIFRRLSRPLFGTRTMTQFYLNYLLLMLVYSFTWWLSPVLSLTIFLLLSMFHFGQSNWNYVSFSSRAESFLVNTAWGGFALLVPIVWHYDEALPIISQITGWQPAPWSVNARLAVCLGLLLINLWIIAYYGWQRKITRRNVRSELVNLAVLGAVFYFLPLLLGFAVYFVFWHSLSSMLDQIRFFRRQEEQYGWRHYVWNALPFSLVAILGLAALVWGQSQLGLNMGIGVLFIFISIVTLPHMILIDRLYGEWERVSKRAISVPDSVFSNSEKERLNIFF